MLVGFFIFRKQEGNGQDVLDMNPQMHLYVGQIYFGKVDQTETRVHYEDLPDHLVQVPYTLDRLNINTVDVDKI